MGDEVIQRGIQFSKPLYDELSKIAKSKGVSFAAIVREACIQYIDDSTPGLCPSCHTQNEPQAQYCNSCGEPITSETITSLRAQIADLEEKVSKVDRLEDALSTIAEDVAFLAEHYDLKTQKPKKIDVT